MSASGQSTPTKQSSRKLTPRTFVALVLGAFLVAFAVRNSQTVTIHWIFGTTKTPLIIVILVAGLFGFAVGWLLARRRAARRISK